MTATIADAVNMIEIVQFWARVREEAASGASAIQRGGQRLWQAGSLAPI